MNTTKIDPNSPKNQEIKDRFVQREIIICQSTLVDELLKKEFYNYEDIENAYSSFGQYGIKTGKCQYCVSDSDLEIDSDQETCEDHFDPQPVEIYEWWIVSEWLLEKLANKEEPILQTNYQDYWGRTTTGQSISLDSVIHKICEEMEILEGQANEWLMD